MTGWALAGIVALFALGPTAIALSGLRVASPFIYAACLALALALGTNALVALLGLTTPVAWTVPFGLPWLGAHFVLDPLSAFFLIVVNIGAAAASLFAIGYGRHEDAPGRVLPFYPVYLAAMNLVPLAADAFSFLVVWEFMSLTSWALVIAHHRDPENLRAGLVYLLMASFGTLALLLAFGLLASAGGDYTFEAMRATHLGPGLAALVLILVLIGTGSKAGLVPLHAWLPLAHPAAPSHVSALMSGVMTKLAVYAFVRIVFDLLGSPAWWWSLLVLALGGISAALGVLYALMQRDLKRVLAYSTIENIGIIFTALGLALAFKAADMPAAAALAATAALLHVFNHTLFKTLMFCGAGAVLNATGERDMEKLGGLIRRMPQTSFLMLVGAAAISALPPLNGFVSEWLTFQAVLLSPELPSWALKLMVPGVGALLALAAALAAACFVRVYGIVFLGRPRTEPAMSAHEVDRFSVTAMGVLALACLLVGIFPGLLIDALRPATVAITGTAIPEQAGQAWLTLVPIADTRSSYNGLLVFGFMLSSGMFAAFAIHRLASAQWRTGPAWDCGFPLQTPVTQYTASSLSQPIRRVFGSVVFRARETGEMPAPGSTAPARLTVTLHDPLWETFYAPISGLIAVAADRLNVLQFLTIRRYLSLVFAALVLLLLVLAAWP